jgi:hypothetical protein
MAELFPGILLDIVDDEWLVDKLPHDGTCIVRPLLSSTFKLNPTCNALLVVVVFICESVIAVFVMCYWGLVLWFRGEGIKDVNTFLSLSKLNLPKKIDSIFFLVFFFTVFVLVSFAGEQPVCRWWWVCRDRGIGTSKKKQFVLLVDLLLTGLGCFLKLCDCWLHRHPVSPWRGSSSWWDWRIKYTTTIPSFERPLYLYISHNTHTTRPCNFEFFISVFISQNCDPRAVNVLGARERKDKL